MGGASIRGGACNRQNTVDICLPIILPLAFSKFAHEKARSCFFFLDECIIRLHRFVLKLTRKRNMLYSNLNFSQSEKSVGNMRMGPLFLNAVPEPSKDT